MTLLIPVILSACPELVSGRNDEVISTIQGMQAFNHFALYQ
jgi:hypothetical protein